MTKFYNRYLCCSVVVVILILMVYYRFYGRFHVDRIVVSSDEFIAVAYVLEDDDDNRRHLKDDQHLLNLTNFQYTLQPSDDICKEHSPDLLGSISSTFSVLINFSLLLIKRKIVQLIDSE